MKNLGPIIGLLLLMPLATLSAQTVEDEVMAVVNRLFDGMREGDTAKVRSVFAPDARLARVVTRDGESLAQTVPVDRFIAIVAGAEQELDERIWDWEVRIDDNLATVWTKYDFRLGGGFSHCGVDAFQLLRLSDGWRIIHIADTFRREGCESPPSG